MEMLNFVEEVLFVIVLYKQPLRECFAFQSLQLLEHKYPGSISIFIHDNSPEPQLPFSNSIEYRHDPSNPGVSLAYNRAFEYARLYQFKFLLLLDQDTSFSENAFNSYSYSAAKYPNVHVFAPSAKDDKKFFSPFRIVRGRGVALSTLASGLYSTKKIKFINSGLLVSVTAFEKSGGYDELFPLDFSDIAFSDRLEKNHFKVCLTDARIQHRHSSNDHADAPHRRARFELYLNALLRYKKNSDQNISYWFSALPRAIKLSGQYSDLGFLRTFFRQRQ